MFPLSRQSLEQIAILLALGALALAGLALWRRRSGLPWARPALSCGALATLTTIALGLAYTVAPNVPTPPVPFTARFATNPVADSPEAVAAGRATFQAKCAICHGAGARGDGPAALTLRPRPVDLTLHVRQHAPGELFYWISEGVAGTGMPAWKGELTQTQRWEVIRFLEALTQGRG